METFHFIDSVCQDIARRKLNYFFTFLKKKTKTSKQKPDLPDAKEVNPDISA